MSISNFDDMLALFSGEARELLEQFEEDLQRLHRNPGDNSALEQAFRSMHTLKGSSGMLALRAGDEGQVRRLKLMSTLGKVAEKRLRAAHTGEAPLNAKIVRALDNIPALVAPILETNVQSGGEGILEKIEELHVLFDTGELPPGRQQLSPDDLDALFRADATAREPEPEPDTDLHSEDMLDAAADDLLRGLEGTTGGAATQRSLDAYRGSAPPPEAPSKGEDAGSRVDEEDLDVVENLVETQAVPEPVVEEPAAEPTPAPPQAAPDEAATGEAAMDALAFLMGEDDDAASDPESSAPDAAPADEPVESELSELDDVLGSSDTSDTDEPETSTEPDSTLDDLLESSDSAGDDEPDVAPLATEAEDDHAAAPVELDEMLGVFIEECSQLIAEMRQALSRLDADLHDGNAYQVLRRGAHTVKGSAAMLGYEPFRAFGLAFEESAEQAEQFAADATPEDVATFSEAVDWLEASVMLLRTGLSPNEATGAPIEALAARAGQETAPEPPPEELDLEDVPEPEEIKEPVPEPEEPAEASTEPDADDPMRAIYLEEASQLLEQLNQCLLALEKQPGDAETVHSILRAAHTIKGSAAMLGYEVTRAVAHRMEDALQLIRDEHITPDAQAIDVLLRATDIIDTLSKDVFRTGKENTSVDEIVGELDSLRTRLSAGQPPAQAPTGGLGTVTGMDDQSTAAETAALRDVFLEEARELLDTLGKDLVDIEKNPEDRNTIHDALRTAHTLKGSAAMLGFERTRSLAHALEDTLQVARDGGTSITSDTADLMLSGLDVLERLFEGIANRAAEPDDDALADHVTKLRAIAGVKEPPPPSAEADLDDLGGFELPIDAFEQPQAPQENLPIAEVEVDVSDVTEESFRDGAHDAQVELTRSIVSLELTPSDDESRTRFRQAARYLADAGAKLGHENVNRLAAAMEGLVRASQERGPLMGSPAVEALNEALEVMNSVLTTLRTEGNDHSPPVDEMVAQLENVSLRRRSGAKPEEERQAAPVVEEKTKEELEQDEEKRRQDERRGRSRSIEVDLNRLNRLMNLAAELVISRTRLSTELERLSGIVDEVGQQGASLDAIQQRLFELKGAPSTRSEEGPAANDSAPAEGVLDSFSAGEFDRFTEVDVIGRDLRDSATTIGELSGDFSGMAANFDQNITRISTIAKDLHDEILRVRMVRMERAFTRIPRILRDAARSEEKQVNLVLEGAETEIDKNILEAMNNPLLHLIRNTVSHGIEKPEVRVENGKPPEGVVTVRAAQDGNHVVVEVADDGRGIDPDALRRTAVERGVISRGQADSLTDTEMMELIFEPGFSSAKEVNELSGRGVGLDVVRSVANRFNGSVSVESTPGRGSTFRVTLPLTLAIGQALLVEIAGRPFALPLASVSQIEEVPPEDVSIVRDKPYIYREELPVPLLQLNDALGLVNGDAPEMDSQSVVLVREGDRQTALAVDRILGREDIVIKNLGGHLRRVPGISGATILGDGSVVMILNVPYFLNPLTSTQRRTATAPSRSVKAKPRKAEPAAKPVSKTPAAAAPIEPEPAAVRASSILVVDDSISIRKYVSGVLERAGFKVTTANDGVDAWQRLQAGMFDLVISDLEMPRMHGYELIAEIKKTDRTRSIPVVFLTARAGEKHRRMGIELGASAFLNKPFSEPELLKLVNELIRK